MKSWSPALTRTAREMPGRWEGRDRGLDSEGRDLNFPFGSRVPLRRERPGPYHPTRDRQNRNRQNVSEGYRLLPMVLNSFEILLPRPFIAAIAATATRAAISA